MCASRQEKIQLWLSSLPEHQFDLSALAAASSDASFRRYFRVPCLAVGKTFIVMDAPPDKEDVKPFMRVADALRQAGVRAPVIVASQVSDGFLLLEDFGGQTLLQALQAESVPADALYRAALSDLVNMQANTSVEGLPVYDEARLQQEMDLFEEWYVKRHLGGELTAQEQIWLKNIHHILIRSARAEAQVFVHRDYHSRNLMVIEPSTPPVLGMLDFQDAVVGPLSYDVVSLLRDAYVAWPEAQQLDWAIRYWEQARKVGLDVPADPSEFYRQVDFMGLQRHLKVLGIFARLNYRDGKAQYLNDLPLVLSYVRNVAGRYSALKPLLYILDRLNNKTNTVEYSF